MNDFLRVESGDEWQKRCNEIDKEQCRAENETQKEMNDKEKPKMDYLKYVQSANDLLARDFPETNGLFQTFCPKAQQFLLVRRNRAKSWMALNIALAVANGETALDKIQVEKGDVLYLALEDGAKRMQKRLKGLLNGKPTPEGLSFAFNFPLSNEGGLEAIKEWLEVTPNARLIVVDTLKRFRPLERFRQSIYNADYDAVSGLNDLAQEYGIGILVVTHTNKQDADEMDWFHKVSGSLGLTGAVDAAMLLERPRNEKQGKLSVSGRDTEEKALAVQFDGIEIGWTLIGEAFSTMANKIQNWLSSAGKNGLSRSEINKFNGNRAEGVEDALHELEAAKLVKSQTIETASKPQERWSLIDVAST